MQLRPAQVARVDADGALPQEPAQVRPHRKGVQAHHEAASYQGRILSHMGWSLFLINQIKVQNNFLNEYLREYSFKTHRASYVQFVPKTFIDPISEFKL